MSKMLEAMRQAAAARSDDLRSVTSSQLEETVFFYPMTVGEITKMQRKHSGFLSSAGTSFEALIDLIIMKALTEDGEKMFTLKDKMLLNRQDLGVVSEIAAAIMSADSVETIEGN